MFAFSSPSNRVKEIKITKLDKIRFIFTESGTTKRINQTILKAGESKEKKLIKFKYSWVLDLNPFFFHIILNLFTHEYYGPRRNLRR